MHVLPLDKVIELAEFVAIEEREPFMLHGQPGGGKSEGVAQLAARHGATKENKRFIDIRLGQYDQVDLRGIPDLDKAAGLTTWYAPSTLPFKSNKRFAKMTAGLIFLFLDELNSAVPGVQGVAYQLINDRCIGEHELMDNVVIIAAGNREGDRGVVNRMPLPLANRMTHVEVSVDIEAVSAHFDKIGIPQVCIAYLNFKKGDLNTFNPNSGEKVFATPRTWVKAMKYYQNPRMPHDLKLAAMAGAIGEGPSSGFWGFVDVWQRITPLAQILKDPMGVKIPPVEEQGFRYAMAVSCSGHMTAKNAGPLHQYLTRLDPEYTVLAWQLATKRDTNLVRVPEFIQFSQQYKEMFNR